MTIAHVSLGIDVSKARLDAYASEPGEKRGFANDAAGIAALVGWAAKLKAFVVLEATASYDQPLIRALEKARVGFHRANPRKAREFARAAGVLAKTDQVDARMLALYGTALALRPTPVLSPARRRLKALVTRRDQLVELRKMERTRLSEAADEPWLRESLTAMIAALDGQVRAIEAAIKTCVRSDGELAQAYELACSAPYVGPVTAAVLLAQMPELGQTDRRAIAALAGLAPLACDSGAFKGRRRIWGGRKRVRDALYMAALGAIRSGPLQPNYRSMIQAGKPPKLALIAIARKLLVQINAAFKAQSFLTPQHSC